MFLRLAALIVLVLASSAPVAAQSAPAASTLSEAQQQEIREIVKQYLIANPSVVNEVLESHETWKAEEEARKQADVIQANLSRFITSGRTPVLGNPQGDVTIIEFFDYNCGYCRAVAPALEQLVKNDGNIRLVMREYPILADESADAAKFALAAGMQGKYAEIHNKVMDGDGQADEASMIRAANQLGLDITKLRSDAESPATEAEIRESYALARDLDINGTPAFIIGNRLFPRAISLEDMAKAVEEARKANNPQ
jgi:protein-disulfide isomerase